MRRLINLAFVVIITISYMACNKDEIARYGGSNQDDCIEIESIISHVTDTVPIWDAGEMQYGRISGYKLNKPWEASAFTVKDKFNKSNLNLSFITYVDDGYVRDLLDIMNVPRKQGCYEIWPRLFKNDSLVYGGYATYDIDVREDKFHVYKEDGIINQLAIDAISEDSIKGRMAISLLKDKSNTYSDHSPDTVRFYNASFSVKLP